MFDIKKYYEKENLKAIHDYESSLGKIKEICNETAKSKNTYDELFNYTGNHIIKLTDLEKRLDSDYFKSKTFEELLKENNQLYSELLPENYVRSYANPSFCVEMFGDKCGQLISYFYRMYRQYTTYAFQHKIFKMDEYNKLFIDVFDFINNNKIEYDVFKELITEVDRKDQTGQFIIECKEKMDKNFKFYRDIIENSDLNDLRYLFKYGEYIAENEIKTAEFWLDYSDEKIELLVKLIVDSYIRSFIIEGKDIPKKSTVAVCRWNIGQEMMIHQLIKFLHDRSLDVIIISAHSTQVNKQYQYDHRFDNALYFDKKVAHLHKNNYETALKTCKEMRAEKSGTIFFDKFPEIPFIPENKKECLKLSEEQSELLRIYRNNKKEIFNKYQPPEGTGCTVIAFPTPEIGVDFENIFEDYLKVILLENEKYERIQQRMIDVMDKADYVHVKGRGKNLTDIKVKMQEIKKPDKETNFDNCVADINIPLGEVLTTPQLKGSDGVLHLKEAFLEGFKFINLKLIFKDGFIFEYSCSNFEDEDENNRYIEENLFCLHKTLPIGEFAIGTNTIAYVMAKKYNIMNVLPTLITEKMGPHFAIGDTCFVREEDHPLYNILNKKEIIARDNEKSILRKTNINEAYTNCHIDIPLPYDSIDFISIITKKGEKIDIIKNGRFILPGTEELNKPLEANILHSN